MVRSTRVVVLLPLVGLLSLILDKELMGYIMPPPASAPPMMFKLAELTEFEDSVDKPKMKIVGFTDRTYLPIAIRWYDSLLDLGYTRDEVIIACNDEESFAALSNHAKNYTTEACIIPNPDRKNRVLGFWRQLMLKRLQYTREKLKAGVSVLITDIDNVFMRHVPLSHLYAEPFDIIHAHEMRYPTKMFDLQGFVVCSGHQWLRSTNETLHFLGLVMNACGGENVVKCDDQIAYNQALYHKAEIIWDREPNRTDAPRVHGNGPMMNGLLTEEMTGISAVTNHRVKVWDRDIATRWCGDPEICPSLERNWVAMPTQMKSITATHKNKVTRKLLQFDKWKEKCGENGSVRKATNISFEYY